MTTGSRPLAGSVLVDDPKVARAILKDDGFVPTEVVKLVGWLQSETGTDLPYLSRYTPHLLFFMHGPDHLSARRALARFQNPAHTERYRATLVDIIENRLRTLSDTCDLSVDFVWAVLIDILRSHIGVASLDLPTLDRLIVTIKPLLVGDIKLRIFQQLDQSIETVDRLLDQTAPPPDSMLAFLRTQKMGEDAVRALVLAQLAGTGLLGKLLTDLLVSVLSDYADDGQFPTQDWLDRHQEAIMLDNRPLGVVARVADRPSPPCPYAPGTVARLDLTAREARMQTISSRKDGPTYERHLHFGAGPHMCPGAYLVRMVVTETMSAFAHHKIRGRILNTLDETATKGAAASYVTHVPFQKLTPVFTQ